MSTSPQPRIALVAFSSLGDGLIYLMMAENLRRNGFAVTYFGNIGYQLRAWLPQFAIRPYPAVDEMDAALADFDLVIMSPPQFLRDRMDAATTDAMRRKWLLICQKTPDDWRFDLTETKRETLPPAIYTRLQPLLDAGGAMRRRAYTTESVVDITLEYLRDAMGLQDLTRDVPLTPPPQLQLRRYPERIVVSPDSAWPEKKDWPPRAFLKLCRRLRAAGATRRSSSLRPTMPSGGRCRATISTRRCFPTSANSPPTSMNPARWSATTRATAIWRPSSAFPRSPSTARRILTSTGGRTGSRPAWSARASSCPACAARSGNPSSRSATSLTP